MALSARVPLLSAAKLNRFLAALPVHDYDLLEPNLRIVSVCCGVVLHNPGDAIEHIYFPHRGAVSVVTTVHGGVMVETALLGPASIICGNAAVGSGFAVGQALVQLPLTASRLSIAQFHDAAKQSLGIRDLAIRYNDLLLAQVQRSVACNTMHPLEQRLARWLLQACDCWDEGALPVTQEFLGQMLGVRRTSLNLSAHALQSLDVISCRRGRIHIIDRGALERRSCDCYLAMAEAVNKVLPPQNDYHAARAVHPQSRRLQTFEN